jgi:hypothetical protein
MNIDQVKVPSDSVLRAMRTTAHPTGLGGFSENKLDVELLKTMAAACKSAMA